ncbi:hypothetical protein BDK51DRAFT_27851 [Blyttiomyces helicus]|uniref:Uncharacterized protein n=1 Tax=Blyttiomyces helicus TaxID=388810 RepID=A0A4P9W1C6_9FUNG|nr:hypothetical protein BDK51DRAFT_27851 [Blyttiomyces helicus]|eukprot:RKO84953.1 hypothetical protein BDK51DRAFT_27851 [Blyttiomyces helicus]
MSAIGKHIRRLSDGLFRPAIKDKTPEIKPEAAADPIGIKLGDLELVYRDKEWVVEKGPAPPPTAPSPASVDATLQQLIEKNRALEGENQLLKYKMNVLVDMLAGSKLDTLRLQGKC